MDRRFFATKELRASADGRKIEGYASVFNVIAQLPGFRERILPGAFTRAIREKQDCVCLFNHDANHVLGRTSSGTLRLSQDSKGLYYACDLPNTQAARDLHESIRRGDVNGCSFAFTMVDNGQQWDNDDVDGALLRSISDLNLHDVSPVTYPCYAQTEVTARELELVGAELRSHRSQPSGKNSRCHFGNADVEFEIADRRKRLLF